MTIHPNEGNYMAHTQGKRHQENLAKRAAMDEKAKQALPAPASSATKAVAGVKRRAIKIGRPGYRVVKQRDPSTGQRSLLFEVDYPEIEEGLQPRHRFMSSFEQRVETPDRAFQYLLFAAAPYETIAFKIPALEIDRDPSKFYTHWDPDRRTFSLQMHFKLGAKLPPAPTSSSAAATSGSASSAGGSGSGLGSSGGGLAGASGPGTGMGGGVGMGAFAGLGFGGR